MSTYSPGGIKPAYMILENEASPVFQREPKAKDVDFQLSSPVIHIHNAAEHAIITFKYHFIAGICSTEPDFPMQKWDLLLEQAEITLNLLLPSRLNPKLW